MRCTHCGANIPEDQMVCPECGAEVQIVPDYNPLEDVLTREVRGSVEGATRQIRTDDIRRQRRESRTQNVNSTRVVSQGEIDRIRDERREKARRQQQMMKRKEAALRRRRNLLLTLFIFLVLIVAGVYVIYHNSYTGVVRRGYDALQAGSYEEAQGLFDRAVVKDRSRAEAYTGLAEVYMEQDDLEAAESVFLTALETQPSNVELYRAAIDFYVNSGQQSKISALLEDCEDKSVLDAVAEYVSDAPEFSLKEGTYTEVQEVSISSDTGGTIYYTTDGSDPTEGSTVYEEPVLLQNEGETEIRAVSVNENGIPSVIASAVYTIEFPIVDAPAVTPATGQYTEPTTITITVPEGYTAYYTMDGSTPTTDSEKYTGPVDMPENSQTIFSAILVNDQNGKSTAVTTRNYITRSE